MTMILKKGVGLPYMVPQNKPYGQVQTNGTPTTVGYGSNIPAKEFSDFSTQQAITQGFRQTLSQGRNDATYTLTIAGRRLEGVSINIATLASITDTYITVTVNGYALVTGVNALMLCPNYVQGMIFFPTPYLLAGNDKLIVTYEKNDANTITVGWNFRYYPQLPK